VENNSLDHKKLLLSSWTCLCSSSEIELGKIEGGGKKKKKVFECAFLLLLIFCGKIRWT
jgi:hypothetical protein